MSRTTRRSVKATLAKTSAPQIIPNVELEPEQPSTVDEPFTALRDITHRFLMRESLNPSTPAPTQRRRRPKIPSTTAKLRMARELPPTPAQVSRPIPVSSSLPPSSPLSTSSRDVATLDGPEVCAGSVAPDVTAVELHHPQAGDNNRIRTSPSSPDPFGFLAVERKLKAARIRRANYETYGFVDDSEWHALDSDDDLYFDEGEASIHIFPTPMPRANSRRLGMGNGAKKTDTSTPHGRPQKRRPRVSVGTSTPHTSSRPSTPSPSKPWGLPQLLPDEESPEPESRRRNISLAPIQKATGGKKQRTDGRSVARNLEGLLLKRTRRVNVVRDRKNEEDRQPGKAPKTRKAIKGKGKVTTKKAKPEEKAVKLKGGGAEEEPENEKWAQERQARIEYFKRLAEYSFEKENVYIV